MTDEIIQMIQQILDYSDEQKVDLGKESLGRFLNGLMQGGIEEKDLPQFIVAFTRLFVSADRKCSQKEFEFFTNVTGIKMSYQDFYEMSNGGASPEYVKGLLEWVSKLNKDDRIALILYGVALLSSDNVVEQKELVLIDQILSC